MAMEVNDNFLKLQITTLDMFKMLLFGSSIMGGIIAGVSYGIYLLYGLFKKDTLASILLIFNTITLWNFIPILLLIVVAFRISSIFFFQGLSDLLFLMKHQGIIFYMDIKGMQFYNFNTKEFKTKTWAEFEDVGCYKQESEKLSYKNQIKFTDGDVYNFDLRGTISTKEFQEKIEDFYLKYCD
ncbi:hypothetical protein [Enterococcus sp. 12E11_DIV0728]|jgi:hypothetical protein|nr:hypothetical protein [Enterococcus sp. 12E11_DIV0728]